MEAWFSTALDIEEVLSGARDDQLHVMVADVIKSFDTVDGSMLDCALGWRGLRHWLMRVHFAFHSQIRLRFKLAAGLGELWCRDGGIPQGCPLSMIFIVALYVPWCRRLEAVPSVRPQLNADNLECSSVCPPTMFGAARFRAQHVRSVGQDVSPGKCVLLSTSKAVKQSMKLWDVSGDGKPWSVELDLMSGILVVICTSLGGLELVLFLYVLGMLHMGALPLEFQEKLGLVRGNHLPAGLRAVEASNVSASSLSVFRAAIVRSVWSSKMPLANTPVFLNLLDGSVGVDPAFHIVWTRFRLVRRYLAQRPLEAARIFRMLDFIARGADVLSGCFRGF